MTMTHDARDDAQKRELTPEQREATMKLEKDAELRQLATDALVTHENPNDYVRQDLLQHAVEKQNGDRTRLTNVGATAIAERIIDERQTFERDLHEKALRAYQQPQGHEGGGGRSFAENMREHYKEQGVEMDIPTFMGTERLKFMRVANVEDIARSGLTQPQHHEVLKKDIPLQHQQNPRLVIGPAPGDLQHSAQDYKQQREAGPFDGCAVYEIVSD